MIKINVILKTVKLMRQIVKVPCSMGCVIWCNCNCSNQNLLHVSLFFVVVWNDCVWMIKSRADKVQSIKLKRIKSLTYTYKQTKLDGLVNKITWILTEYTHITMRKMHAIVSHLMLTEHWSNDLILQKIIHHIHIENIQQKLQRIFFHCSLSIDEKLNIRIFRCNFFCVLRKCVTLEYSSILN